MHKELYSYNKMREIRRIRAEHQARMEEVRTMLKLEEYLKNKVEK